MDEATPHRAQGDLPMTPTTTPEQLTALAQAMTEVTEEIHAPTDELDGLSSRLGLIAGALTGTAAAARRMAQLAKDDDRSQMSTRERLLDSAGDTLKDCPTCGGGGDDPEAIPPPLPCSDCDGTGKVRGVALQGDAEDPGDERCLQCNGLLPDTAAWLCPKCELLLQGEAEDAAAAEAWESDLSRADRAQRVDEAHTGQVGPTKDDRQRTPRQGIEGASAASDAPPRAPSPLDDEVRP